MEPLRPARLGALAQQPDRGAHVALVGEGARGDDPALGHDLRARATRRAAPPTAPPPPPSARGPGDSRRAPGARRSPGSGAGRPRGDATRVRPLALPVERQARGARGPRPPPAPDRRAGAAGGSPPRSAPARRRGPRRPAGAPPTPPAASPTAAARSLATVPRRAGAGTRRRAGALTACVAWRRTGAASSLPLLGLPRRRGPGSRGGPRAGRHPAGTRARGGGCGVTWRAPAGHRPPALPRRRAPGLLGPGLRLAAAPACGVSGAGLMRASVARARTRRSPRRRGLRSLEKSGGDLLSQGASPQVPSALAGLTSVFGMGTGVTPPLWPPETCFQSPRVFPRDFHSEHERVCFQALGRLVPVG